MVAYQLVHAYMLSTQQYGNIMFGVFSLVRTALDVVGTGVLIFAVFVGRKQQGYT